MLALCCVLVLAAPRPSRINLSSILLATSVSLRILPDAGNTVVFFLDDVTFGARPTDKQTLHSKIKRTVIGAIKLLKVVASLFFHAILSLSAKRIYN